jgi:maleylpyruvate isomerase
VSGSGVDAGAVERDIDALEASQRALTVHLHAVGAVDPSAPSLLPGWSLGHVLTHIARNADSSLRMLAGLPQYWMGFESREADIALGAGRGWDELVADVAETSDAVVRRMREVSDWTGEISGTSGARPKATAASMRKREVEVHRADLGLGYGFVDMPTEFVRFESRRLEMLWKARQPMGMTSLPDPVLRLPEHERLAWLFGRTVVDGVAPAGVA